MAAPREGLPVVAVERAVSASFAVRMLGDLGARVVKIEVPGTGAFTRQYDDAVRGMSPPVTWLNRHKESLAPSTHRWDRCRVCRRCPPAPPGTCRSAGFRRSGEDTYDIINELGLAAAGSRPEED